MLLYADKSDTEQARSNEGDLTEQIFDWFKTHLDQKVVTLTTDLTSQTNTQSKHLERQSEGRQLEFEGNKDQFLFTTKLQEHIDTSSGLLKQADIRGALEKLEPARNRFTTARRRSSLLIKAKWGGSQLKNMRPRISQAILKMRSELKKPRPQLYKRSQSYGKRRLSTQNIKVILALVLLAVATINFFEVMYAYISIVTQAVSFGRAHMKPFL